jgi:hypothetical protein
VVPQCQIEGLLDRVLGHERGNLIQRFARPDEAAIPEPIFLNYRAAQ